jgi:hypothetical protein
MSNILLPTPSDGPVGIEMHRSRPAQGIDQIRTNRAMQQGVRMRHRAASSAGQDSGHGREHWREGSTGVSDYRAGQWSQWSLQP